jgi:hypothetical protein
MLVLGFFNDMLCFVIARDEAICVTNKLYLQFANDPEL